MAKVGPTPASVVMNRYTVACPDRQQTGAGFGRSDRQPLNYATDTRMAPARRAAANRGRRIGSPRPSAPLPGHFASSLHGKPTAARDERGPSALSAPFVGHSGRFHRRTRLSRRPGRSGELFEPGTTPDPAMGEQPVIVRFGRLGHPCANRAEQDRGCAQRCPPRKLGHRHRRRPGRAATAQQPDRTSLTPGYR